MALNRIACGAAGACANTWQDQVAHEAQGVIGELPSLNSILGTLVRHSDPIRRPDLGARSGIPGARVRPSAVPSLLAVPILIRGEVLDSLSLGGKIGPMPFADLDEEIVVALAVGAGIAIENT